VVLLFARSPSRIHSCLICKHLSNKRQAGTSPHRSGEYEAKLYRARVERAGCGGSGVEPAKLWDATVIVDNPDVASCPGGGTLAALSVQVFPTGFGTVTGSTSGISCPGQCTAVIPVGASVGLTAVPASGHSLLSWTGCATSSGNDCTVTMPLGGANVLAQFQ
jgi:hypothetical protein